ncbi:hypothetical protein NZ47_13225 [Anaerovibrio lipolyticus]|uniref:Uncharacterized protein n=1 Tax=Anaerovibrio lipolyticus TaxID=82374 RepID=A0A0B2JKX4_9FIRM|nr:hypothetical protein NZ47_13225 [Anaerovibrio lipolyticus]
MGKRKKTSPKSKTSLFPAGVGPAMSNIVCIYIVGRFLRKSRHGGPALIFAGVGQQMEWYE